MAKTMAQPAIVLGWREMVSLPDLGLGAVKAKLDTGARTSALDVEDVDIYEDPRGPRARFVMRPNPHNYELRVLADAPLVEHRRIKSSMGNTQNRPVIRTTVEVAGQSWQIEVSLVNRSTMGFPMLLGRTAIRRRFWIDPARSFLQSPVAQRKRLKRGL